MELHRWRLEEDKKLEETGTPEEVAIVLAERNRAERAAALKEERKNSSGNTEYTPTHSAISYKKYTIEDIEKATNSFSPSLKVGEGGYGPVFKCDLDHTKVAVKVLRPDAAQGRTQFQQEVKMQEFCYFTKSPIPTLKLRSVNSLDKVVKITYDNQTTHAPARSQPIGLLVKHFLQLRKS